MTTHPMSGLPSNVVVRGRVPQAMLSGPVTEGARGGLIPLEVHLQDGRIAAVRPPGGPPSHAGATVLDLQGGIILPGLVDCHTHLDKGQVAARSPNADGRFVTALAAAAADAARHGGIDDLVLRAEFQLRAAFAHGTVAVRSHVDAHPDRFDRRFDALLNLRAAWAGRIAVQLCPFAGQDAPPGWIAHLAGRAGQGGGALSLFVQDGPGLDGFLDMAVDLAGRHGLDLDFHADETTDPASNATARIVAAVARAGFDRQVTVGHGVALAGHAPDDLARTLDAMAQAGVALVALPQCNAHLMGRTPGRTPRLRGLAPVHEARAAGVRVALASDNTRDPFHAYGDLDMVELFRDAIRFGQLDQPVGDWPAAIGPVPAGIMGLPSATGCIAAGGPADLILLTARNWSEFGARPATGRIVLRAGQPIDTTPPDWRDLDALDGMDP
ncbi:MAG: cytosine deaminase [Cypionkella sp.]|nr:cytosine deaminase [Cypionkella sp.]